MSRQRALKRAQQRAQRRAPGPRRAPDPQPPSDDQQAEGHGDRPAGQGDRPAGRVPEGRQRPRRGRRGWAGMRRSRGQRLGITAVAIGGLAAIWTFGVVAQEWGLAILLSALLLLALPAFVVLTIGRR